MSTELTGKVAIVTGASSGIGWAMAEHLAAAGCKVAVAARNGDKLATLADTIGDNALPVVTDLTNSTDIDQLIARTVDAFGGIDILYANAGIFITGPFEDSGPAHISELLRVNVEGVMHCARAVLPHMRARGAGDILIVSSIAGVDELRGEPIYSASKHAIQAFARILRRQVCADGIRVGAICPGTVATPLWGITEPAEVARRIAQRDALSAEDIAETSMFMLTRPPHVTIRDLVILPQAQDI